MHLNAQGIVEKNLQLEVLLEIHPTDILCVSEHWLSASDIRYFKIKNYVLINSFCREKHIRGGVCIFAKEFLNFKPHSVIKSIEKNFEICLARYDDIKRGCVLYIVVVYRSPKSNVHIFIDTLYELMYKIYEPNNNYIVCGDVNIDSLIDNGDTKKLFNLFAEFGMFNHISKPTRITGTSSTGVDVIFSNIEAKLSFVGDTHISDHTFQLCSFLISKGSRVAEDITYSRDYGDANLMAFRNMLLHEKWSDVYLSQDVNDVFNSFLTTYQFHYNKAFTFKKVHHRKLIKPWFDIQLRELHTTLCELTKLAKSTNNEIIKRRQKDLKAIYRNLVNTSKRHYNEKRLHNATNFNRECWKIIDETRKSSNQDRIELNINNEIVTDEQRICNYLSKFFVEVTADAPDYVNLKLTDFVKNTFFLNPIISHEVEDIINNTVKKPAAGVDGIHGRTLKAVSDIICFPLSHIINVSFNKGVYPDKLKISKSIPIYKNKGSHSDPQNYRNISLTSQFSKIIESAFKARLSKFLERNHLLPNFQHGFRAGRSTETAIKDLCLSLYLHLNGKKNPVALYFDLSRAFDTIDHRLLLVKLERIGIRGIGNDWVASYLQDRTQIVAYKSFTSDPCPVTKGVPQGSILGPLFFIIFMSDLQYSCYNAYSNIIYADDTNQLIADTTLERSVTVANTCANDFNLWCKTNGLIVNEKKTFYMVFQQKNISYDFSPLIRINKNSIEQVKHIKFLGVIVDEKLTWEKHCDSLVVKLSSLCFLIRQLKHTVSATVLKSVYYGLVYSILCYGIIFWGNSCHASKVFVMQKKIVRCMLGVHPQEHCKPLFKQMELLTLPCIYIYKITMDIKKHEHMYVKNNMLHHYNTRINQNLHLRFSRLSVGQDCHTYQGLKCYNHFINKFGNASFNKFRCVLSEYLLNNSFYSLEEYLSV